MIYYPNGGESRLPYGWTAIPNPQPGWNEYNGIVYSDSYDPDTLLLLHMDGEDNGTIFIDSSMFSNIITRSGNPVTKTSVKKFGSSSAYFNNSSYLNIPDLGDFTGDFTWEAWVYITGGTYNSIYGSAYSQNNGIFKMYRPGANLNRPYFYSSFAQTNGTDIFNDNTWTHLACVRSQGIITVYMNGIFHSSCSYSGTISLGQGLVGKTGGYNEYFNGYIDELRISRIAKWTSNFTPPNEPYKK